MINEIIKEKLNTFKQILDEIPNFRYVGDPILRSKTKKITNIKEGIEIGEQLGKTLIQYRKIAHIGRGLAAPQLGIDKSVFVTFVDDKLQTFINPVIVDKSSSTNYYKELCLSSGIMATDVERPEWISMEWLDIEGNKHTQKFEGFLARLYQHEESHLRGIVNLDEAAPQGIEILTFDPLKEQLRKTR